MKIKKLILCNIGPYVNENIFDFSIDKYKNIVLIGGKNGAGKTTFFKSIKTCLYGCKVWGFDAPGKEYYAIISSLVNAKTQYDISAKAFIETELFFDDGKQQDIYILHREWIREKKTFVESFHVYKNGQLIEGDMVADFTNYLLSVIPPDMFNFYFFDGESIADFFLGPDGNKNFKNAFLKLYSLDTVSILIENFERHHKKKDSGKSIVELYNQAKKDFATISAKKENLLKQKEEYENSLDLIDIRIQTLQKEYTHQGGISITEWKELVASMSKEEFFREEKNRYLKDLANNVIPFIILKKVLEELKARIISEQEMTKSCIVREVITKESFIEKLQSFLNMKEPNIPSKSIINFICETIEKEQTSVESLFDYSSTQAQRLLSQIDEKQSFDEVIITETIKQIDKSLKQTKKLRDKLVKCSVDGFYEFSQQRADLEKEQQTLILSIEKINNEILECDREYDDAKILFEKTKLEYENILKNNSITDLSTKAVAAYTILLEKLVLRQSKILQNEFINCFSQIINKDNFVDGIVIDNNINIVPYKYLNVSYSQIDNYLSVMKKSGFLDYFDNKCVPQINDLRLGNKDYVLLPSPINVPFSQGEKQVFIMSLYLALLKTSKKNMPFFIDTPFARIDSNHRMNIVKKFFMGIPNQLFILSTDEEIVDEYKEIMDERISSKFELVINSYGKTSIISNHYFGEQ